MTEDKKENTGQAATAQITPELLKEAGLSPDLLNLLLGIALASVLPQSGLLKMLIAKDLITRDEAAGLYEELLKSSQFPPGMNELIRPIWTQTAEAIRKGEK